QDFFVMKDGLFVVCDGVGGHRGGEVASQTAVEAIAESFEHRSVHGLIGAVLRANRLVWERAQADPSLRGMATTVTALGLVRDGDDDILALVNVGDSRGY